MYKLTEVDPANVFILCGGLGKRFREIREDIPKSLAPIKGVPFLDLLLNDLVFQGFKRIILGTGYLGDQIEVHLQKRTDAEFLISREESPLGTGGAIRNALPLFESEQVLVLNGDSYISFSAETLLKFHENQQADSTILVSSSTKGKDYGNIVLGERNKILSFKEKPDKSTGSLINAGVYCIQKKLIRLQSEGRASLERDWLPLWITKRRVLGMVIKQSFYDIGTRERFELAQNNYNLSPFPN